MRGAGGSEGGIFRFVIGLAMMIGGGYLFFDSIRVSSGFHWGMPLYGLGGFGFSLTSGMVFIPFIFGIAIVFYDARNRIGWVLAVGSLLALAFGVIRSLRFTFQTMTTFDLLVILVLLFGGTGLFLSSLRDFSAESDDPSSHGDR